VCVWSVQNIWDLSISEVGVGSLSNRLHRESDKWAWLITTPNKLIGARICKPKCVTTLSNSHLGVAKINLVGRPWLTLASRDPVPLTANPISSPQEPLLYV
jgi:hypothetical protein